MTTTDGHDDRSRSDVLRSLKARVAVIESTSTDIRDAAAGTRARRAAGIVAPQPVPTQFNAGKPLPDGDDWLERRPARYVDGERGFDLRILRELAAVGVRCYTVQDLIHYYPTVPPAIPILVDWLANLDEKLPGPETRHRATMRISLIQHLGEPAARGNAEAIAALLSQLRRDPPLQPYDQYFAANSFYKIAGRRYYDDVIALFQGALSSVGKDPLLRYLGQFATPEAKRIARDHLDDFMTRQSAIRALARMKATGVRDAVAAYADDPNEQVRKEVARAMKRLPA